MVKQLNLEENKERNTFPHLIYIDNGGNMVLPFTQLQYKVNNTGKLNIAN